MQAILDYRFATFKQVETRDKNTASEFETKESKYKSEIKYEESK